MASASERIQISWRLLVSSWPRVGHVSQLLIIEHYVNHVASDIPSCVIRRPVCRPGKVIMCRDKAQLCFKQEITFSWSWKQQACLCLDGVPHLLSHAGVSCNSRILQLVLTSASWSCPPAIYMLEVPVTFGFLQVPPPLSGLGC